MARFRYRLQSVLDMKVQMETQAKQEFAAAQQRLHLQEDLLEALRGQLLQLEQESKGLLTGPLHIRDIEQNAIARAWKEGEIAKQQEAVRKATNEVERARVHLAEVVMERKTHEKLREKAFEEFRLEENRAEGKQVDELTSYTYGQKSNQ